MKVSWRKQRPGQVRRSDFDKMLLDKAKSLGVPIINGKQPV